jgi:hypothetical protein
MLLDIDHMCDGSGRLLALEDPSLSGKTGDRVLRDKFGQTPINIYMGQWYKSYLSVKAN